MKNNNLKIAVAALSCLMSTSVWAMPAAPECELPGSVRVALSSVAGTEVPNDELVLGFSSLSKAMSSAQASAKANQVLSNRLPYFKGLPGVKEVRSSLSTYQDYQSKGWVGQAQVTLVMDFAKSASLDIQSEPFGVSSTSTRSSEQAVLNAKAPLIEVAVNELQQKGLLLAKAANKKTFTLKSMDLQDGSGGQPPMQPMLARAMSADVPEISTGNITQGKSQVSVQISATGCLN